MKSLPLTDATRVIGEAQGYLGLAVCDTEIDCAVNGPGTACMITAWALEPGELARLKEGAPIYLRILGTAHPPVMLSVGEAADLMPGGDT